MPIETGSFVNDLTPSNPPSSDPAGQGDDHLRLIKTCVQGTFPNMGAILGQVRRQDTALSISSTWNTNHFLCSASATATVVLTLPPAGSITAGYYVDITTIGTGTVSLLPSGAASINGGTSLSIPRLNTARAYFLGGTAWLADVTPHGQGGYVLGGNLVVQGSTTISGTVVLSNGQLVFPATQNPSAGANTLDDYEEGTWTPVLTFTTPGDLSVAYSLRIGTYTKIGRVVTIVCNVNTSTWTWTTSNGTLAITGLPFTAAALGAGAGFPLAIGAITAAPGTEYQIVGDVLQNTTTINFGVISLTAGTVANLVPASMPSGVQRTVRIQCTYEV